MDDLAGAIYDARRDADLRMFEKARQLAELLEHAEHFPGDFYSHDWSQVANLAGVIERYALHRRPDPAASRRGQNS